MTQGDLFGNPGKTTLSTHLPKTDFLDRYRVTLKLDQALVGAIAMLVLYVLVFSFGVEKGKRYAAEELKAERAKREHLVQEFRDKIFISAEPEPASGTATGPESGGSVKTAPASAPAEIFSAKGEFPQGKYTIQLVTFTSDRIAQDKIKKLSGKGLQGFVIPSGKFKQVCVAAFESRQKASQVLGQLKSEGLAPKDAFIRDIPQVA